MSALEQLLAAVGVGATQLTLALDAGVWPRGARITGSVLLEGGAVDQQIKSLAVRLEEYISHGKSSEWKRRDEEILACPRDSHPGMRAQIPFSLRVPEDARLSQSHVSHVSQVWRVSVEADILWAVNPRASLPVTVVPHYEVTAVQRALEKRGFEKTGVYLDFAMRESPDTVVAYYRAPAALREQIDGASLHLRVHGAHVFGRLILNLHQHSVGEHLLALVGGDREEHGFELLRSELLNQKGGPRSEGAGAMLDDMLAQALIVPGNENAKTLLRPASGPPADSRSLLRPAESHGDASPDELLRPSDGPDDTPSAPSNCS